MNNTLSRVENFFSSTEYIKDGIVYANSLPVAMVAPSTLYGECDGDLFVNGKNGIYKIKNNSEESFWETLIVSGSLMFGVESQILECKKLLKSSNTSRTASYFFDIHEKCEEIISSFKKLYSAKVTIVGCGGIGSMAAMNLAGSGLKNITIIDGDFIEESNLNRQLFFSLKDVGKKKVDVIKNSIHARFGDVSVNVIDDFINPDDFKDNGSDVYIISADHPLGVGAAIGEKVVGKVIHCGYAHKYLYYSLVDGGESSKKTIKWIRSHNFIGPSFAPSNTEIAGIVSSLCIKCIIDKVGSTSSSWDSEKFPRGL